MLYKTRAIVLRVFKYSETSIIAKLYTEEFGLLSFMVNGVRKAKSKMPASFFQALQVVNIEMNYNNKTKLHSIKEIGLSIGNQNIHSDISKSSIAQFLAEIIYKTLREEEKNTELFEYLLHSLYYLDEINEKDCANFHLIFMLNFSRFLGFYPTNNYNSENKNFNMLSGNFVSSLVYSNGFEKTTAKVFHNLLNSNYETMKNIDGQERKSILNGLLKYYRFHLPEMGEIYSLDVFETVFS